MSTQGSKGNSGNATRKGILRRRSRSLLAGVSLLALAATPAFGEDWQQRQQDIEYGAVPSFDLGPIELAQAATVLGISTSAADRHWAYARAWLYNELSSDT